MKCFYVEQVRLAYADEPRCVAQGVMFTDGSIALNITLERIKRYYLGNIYRGQENYSKVDLKINEPFIMTFPIFGLAHRGQLSGFRNAFEDSAYTVNWV